MPGQGAAQAVQHGVLGQPFLDEREELGVTHPLTVRYGDDMMGHDIEGVKLVEVREARQRACKGDAVERSEIRNLTGVIMAAEHAEHSNRRGWSGLALVIGATGACFGAACDGGGSLGAPDVSDIDRIDPACKTGPRATGACGEPTIRHDEMAPDVSAQHIEDETPITYAVSPPTLGDHRGVWAKWGEYSYLPPQRWLHNAEHGGIVFLYDPCVSDVIVNALRTFAREVPDDTSGPFRWVMTPYPGLGSQVAVIAWGWAWMSECVDTAAMTTFIAEHYRKATEDVPHPGTYDTGWMSD